MFQESNKNRQQEEEKLFKVFNDKVIITQEAIERSQKEHVISIIVKLQEASKIIQQPIPPPVENKSVAQVEPPKVPEPPKVEEKKEVVIESKKEEEKSPQPISAPSSLPPLKQKSMKFDMPALKPEPQSESAVIPPPKEPLIPEPEKKEEEVVL